MHLTQISLEHKIHWTQTPLEEKMSSQEGFFILHNFCQINRSIDLKNENQSSGKGGLANKLKKGK